METHAIQELPLADRTIAPWSPPANYAMYRRVLVSPTLNTPPAFKGYGGWNGWPEAIRLRNGDLYVAFCAGYDHASLRTPPDAHPDHVAKVKQQPQTLGAPMQAWTFDWDCPTGGRIMWMRSRDNGATWTRPRPFPLIPRLGYYVSHLLQLRDGGLIASVRGQCCVGFFDRMPVNALEFARMAMNRFPPETIFLRSDDNGETWRVWSRMQGPCLRMDAPYGLFETPDGALMMLIPGQPIPFGPGWPAAPDQRAAQWIMLAMRSEDQGRTWTTVSAFGLEHFDANEGCGGYLPDGRIGCLTRPTSAWFQSNDHGRTWSRPLRLQAGDIGSGRETCSVADNSVYLYTKGSLVVTPDGVAVAVFANLQSGGCGQAIYSRDSGRTWIMPDPTHGFQFDPWSYYPSACVLEDGSIFVVGTHEGIAAGMEREVGPNPFGPRTSVVSAMRFRIRTPAEGEGIELLPIGGRESRWREPSAAADGNATHVGRKRPTSLTG